MIQAQARFPELDPIMAEGSGSQRFTILQKITDLFLADVDCYSDAHVGVFDDVMSRLIEKIERQALIELSGRLAPVDRAPANVIGRLSHDDDIEISGPILEKSKVLTDRDLVEIAETKSQAHLSAIAGRKQLNEPVTDVLIHRGNSEVARKVTANEGARFSRFGLSKAVKRAEEDESLADVIANRLDLPVDLLDELVRKATTTVRQRLLANARPEMRERIGRVLAAVSSKVASSITPRAGGAGARTMARHDPARLRTRVSQCAEAGNIEDLTDALAILSKLPVKAVRNLIGQVSDEGMLVLGKACGMGWPELQKVLTVTMPAKTKTPNDMKALFAKFVGLSAADVERAIRFIRTGATKPADELRKFI
ncbi:MAG TPA: DUF2336 domain-containing protein [Alphaproteobacteria bacterium]